MLEDSMVPNLAGTEKTLLALSGLVSLAIRFGNTVYRESFIIAERLAVDVQVGTRLFNTHLKSIDVENQRLLFKPEAIVPILSSKGHFSQRCTHYA